MDRFGLDSVLLVILHLLCPAAVGLVYGALHRVGDAVGVHDDLAGDVAGGAPHGLDEGCLGAKEALFVGVEDGDEADLGKVEPFAQEVDADDDVVDAEAEVAQDLGADEGLHLGVEVVDLDVHLREVVGEVLRHLLRERGDEDALAAGGALPDLPDEVVDLALRGPENDLGVDEAGGTDDLLDALPADAMLVGSRGGGGEDEIADAGLPLLEGEGAVIVGGGKAEAVLDEAVLAGAVGGVLAADLGDGLVALVGDREEVVREVVEQGVGGLAGGAAVEVAGVVLDALAVADLAYHLHVVAGALLQALGFQEAAAVAKEGESVFELGLDECESALLLIRVGDVVGGGEDHAGLALVHDLARDWVDGGDLLDLVAEHLDAGDALFVHREDLQDITADAEGASLEGDVVAVELHGNEAAQEAVAVGGLALANLKGHTGVLLGAA